MYQFQCDYNEGAHQRIMERLLETNFEQTVGYGEDQYCAQARETIKAVVGRDDVDVHFLVGGTQANATVISSVLRPHQGVLCADTGHINVHETGAIEHSGHKVLALKHTNGLLAAETIREAMEEHLAEDGPEHTVQPGMVYISFSSEVGTIYSFQQLKEILIIFNQLNGTETAGNANILCMVFNQVADCVNAAVNRAVRAEVCNLGCYIPLGRFFNDVHKFRHTFVLNCADGNNRHTNQSSHFLHIHTAAIAPQLIHHIQRNHCGNPQSKQL